MLGYTARQRLFNIGMLIVGFLWLCLYAGPVWSWWTRTHADSCKPTEQTGSIERVWATWWSGCTWPSMSDHVAYPALLFAVGIYIVLFGSLARDWHGGPPEWAISFTAFGAAAIAGLCCGGAAAGIAWEILYAEPDPHPSAMHVILSILFVLVAPFALLCWTAGRVHTWVRAAMRGSIRSHASGAVATSSAIIGTTVGVAVTSVVFLGALIVAVVVAPLVIVFFALMMPPLVFVSIAS